MSPFWRGFWRGQVLGAATFAVGVGLYYVLVAVL